MKTMSEAELRRLVPVENGPVIIAPPRRTSPTNLASRAQRHTYEETEALLKELASEW